MKGSGQFEFPKELNKGKWVTDYYVYLVAEEANGDRETNFSSAPVQLAKPELFMFESEIDISVDGKGTATASPVKGYKGTEVTLTTTSERGWIFKEWQVLSGDVTIKDNKFVLGDTDVKIKAVFEHKGIFCEKISMSENLILKIGESVSLNAVITPDDADDKSLSWTSDNENIAKVSDSGIVTAVNCGYAVISATNKKSGVSAECSIKVMPVYIDDNDSRSHISPEDLEKYVIPEYTAGKSVTASQINIGSKKEPKKVDISISMNCYNAVNYTGKAATPQNDPSFGFSLDYSSLLTAAGRSDLIGKEVFKISYVGKSKNAGPGEFYAKLALAPKAKKTFNLSVQEQKVLKKLIAAANKELKKADNRIKFTINKASILNFEPIEIHAKLDKNDKIKYKDDKLKGLKSVKGKLKPTDTKAKKLSKSTYSIKVIDGNTNLVRLSGAGKNFTGFTTLTVTK
ncbi:MAG: Ig-like domain-containing protein [Lachnospiraceae bacterium]|nr:Ig-like domain-containing protein [Lachnospiraceae bacterium]